MRTRDLVLAGVYVIAASSPPVWRLISVPVEPWPGTFQATDSSAVCPQFRDPVSEKYPDDKPVYLEEDCLRLNVWAPRAPGGHPVIVFFHGGAARFGTANEPRYDGSKLAEDAVVVTVNYRLGLLGANNLFLRDQITALGFTGVPGGAEAFQADPAAARALSARMRHAWTSFARTGGPGWPDYRYGRITRIWDTPPSVVFAPREAERAAWDAFGFRFFQ